MLIRSQLSVSRAGDWGFRWMDARAFTMAWHTLESRALSAPTPSLRNVVLMCAGRGDKPSGWGTCMGLTVTARTLGDLGREGCTTLVTGHHGPVAAGTTGAVTCRLDTSLSSVCFLQDIFHRTILGFGVLKLTFFASLTRWHTAFSLSPVKGTSEP